MLKKLSGYFLMQIKIKQGPTPKKNLLKKHVLLIASFLIKKKLLLPPKSIRINEHNKKNKCRFNFSFS